MTYQKISGFVFTIVALAQLLRAVMQWPAMVNGLSIPIWCSVIAFLVAGSLAIWAFRSSGQSNSAGA